MTETWRKGIHLDQKHLDLLQKMATFLFLLLLFASSGAGESERPYVYVPFHPDLVKHQRVQTPPSLLDNPDVAFYRPHAIHPFGYLRQLPPVLWLPDRELIHAGSWISGKGTDKEKENTWTVSKQVSGFLFNK